MQIKLRGQIKTKMTFHLKIGSVLIMVWQLEVGQLFYRTSTKVSAFGSWQRIYFGYGFRYVSVNGSGIGSDIKDIDFISDS